MDGENFIAFSCGGQLRGELDQLFKGKGVRPNVVMETPNDRIIYGLVAAGRGVAIVPFPLDGAPYHTKIISIADRIPQRRLYLQWNTKRYIPPAAKYFRDYIIRSEDVFEQYLKHHSLNVEREEMQEDIEKEIEEIQEEQEGTK